MPGGEWHILGNDKVGDCVFAGAAHEHMLWTMEGGAPRSRFTTKDVLSDYSAVTGYVPGRDETDQGTDMQEAASYRRKTGVLDATGKRHKIDAYMALEIGNADQLFLASWIFGAAGVGFQVPASAEGQFQRREPWHVVPRDRIVGGHYVPAVGRSESGNVVVITWGAAQEMSLEFLTAYNDESVVYLSEEFLRGSDKLSPEGFNLELLGKYLKGISK